MRVRVAERPNDRGVVLRHRLPRGAEELVVEFLEERVHVGVGIPHELRGDVVVDEVVPDGPVLRVKALAAGLAEVRDVGADGVDELERPIPRAAAVIVLVEVHVRDNALPVGQQLRVLHVRRAGRVIDRVQVAVGRVVAEHQRERGMGLEVGILRRAVVHVIGARQDLCVRVGLHQLLGHRVVEDERAAGHTLIARDIRLIERGAVGALAVVAAIGVREADHVNVGVAVEQRGHVGGGLLDDLGVRGAGLRVALAAALALDEGEPVGVVLEVLLRAHKPVLRVIDAGLDVEAHPDADGAPVALAAVAPLVAADPAHTEVRPLRLIKLGHHHGRQLRHDLTDAPGQEPAHAQLLQQLAGAVERGEVVLAADEDVAALGLEREAGHPGRRIAVGVPGDRTDEHAVARLRHLPAHDGQVRAAHLLEVHLQVPRRHLLPWRGLSGQHQRRRGLAIGGQHARRSLDDLHLQVGHLHLRDGRSQSGERVVVRLVRELPEGEVKAGLTGHQLQAGVDAVAAHVHHRAAHLPGTEQERAGAL